MKIINEPLLQYFRTKRVCEFCGEPIRGQGEPHHVFAKGMGSGSRLDVCLNLITVGGAFECNCHGKGHSGNLASFRERCWEIIDAREGLAAGEAKMAVYRLLRRSKP